MLGFLTKMDALEVKKWSFHVGFVSFGLYICKLSAVTSLFIPVRYT